MESEIIVLGFEGQLTAEAAIPVMASDLKAAGISIYLEQVKRDGNLLDPL